MKRWGHPQGDTGVPELSYRHYGKKHDGEKLASRRECFSLVKSDCRHPSQLICKWYNPNKANACCVLREKFALEVCLETGPLCYVAICDRRNLWRCRNLWRKVSQFVTGVAICDGKCRNLSQRHNMQFNDIYSLNFDKYVVLSSYSY